MVRFRKSKVFREVAKEKEFGGFVVGKALTNGW
jgi:hypothetical protein